MDLELFKIVYAFLAFLGGFLALVIRQFIVRFFIEPIHEQSKLLGEVTDSLIYYANLWFDKDREKDIDEARYEEIENAANIIRRQSSQLRATTRTIRWYKFWRLLRFVPKKENIDKLASNLIGWSNSLRSGYPAGCISAREKIIAILGIKAHK